MIEETLAALTAAITENTSVLREVLAAGGAPAPTNVTPITETPKPKGKPKSVTLTKDPEPEPVAVVEPEPAAPVEEAPDIEQPVAAPDTLDPEALIADITDLWKTKLTNADPGRKMTLKEKFPDLRTKWGLEADAKLITLAPTPEKLAGLLADIKEL